MVNNGVNFRLIAVVIFGAVVLILGGLWLINYLTVGQLVITTGSSLNSITISEAGVSPQPSGFPKKASGQVSLTLKSGSYNVEVQGSSQATARVVAVKAHTTASYSIKPPQAYGVEPVTFDSVQDFVADSSHLLYINTADSRVAEINGGNNYTEIAGTDGMKTVSWADATWGVGQDSTGGMWVISNGSVSKLNSPAVYNRNPDTVFSVAPDRTIYLGIGSNVYEGTASGGFKTIFSKREAGSLLVAGPDAVAIINGGETGESTKSDSGAGLVIVSSSGSATESDQGILSAAWSESGKYLALATNSGGEIVDASLHQIAQIPKTGFSVPVWLDDNVVYFAVQDQLWTYNLGTQVATLVADMPLGDSIAELAVSQDKAYIYASIVGTAGSATLSRVGLKGQTVPSVIYNLEDILPETNQDPGYSVGLYNFAGLPNVTVTPGPGTDAQGDLTATKQQLQDDGFDTGQLNFSIIQASFY